MPTPLRSRENFHTIYVYGQPLGVECRRCGRRRLALHDKVKTGQGNMTELRFLKFVCSGCGSRDWAGWLLTSQAEVDGFPAEGVTGG